MSVTLTLTDRARTELADGAARGVRGVTFTRLAIGAGITPAGTDDTARAGLRDQKDAAAVTGDPATPGRIAVRADFSAIAETFAVTEVGLFARTGAAGAEWLAGYWCGAAASDAIARADPVATLIVAGIVEIAASAAEITVTLAANVQVGAPGSASDAREGLVELATLDEARAGADTTRALTPPALADAIPPGVILDFAGGGTLPPGWLACGGQAVSRATYARLYAAIGTAWGAGDGATTFNVPDLRRRVRVGAWGVATSRLGNAVGSRGGSETHTLTASEMPAHTHGDGSLGTSSAGLHRHDLSTQSGDAGSRLGLAEGLFDSLNNVPGMSYAGSHSHDVTGATGSAGAGGAHPILQPSAVVAPIIRY